MWPGNLETLEPSSWKTVGVFMSFRVFSARIANFQQSINGKKKKKMLTPNLKCKNSRIEFIFILSFVVEVLGFAFNFNLKYNLKSLSSIFQIIIIMANAL